MAKKKEKIKKIVEKSFLDILKNTFEKNLVSVTLYGSYVTENFVEGVSDINILVLLDTPSPQSIVVLGKAAHKLMRRYKITPLILSKTEFMNSADVFPMEYLDIQEWHSVLYGEDETKSLTLTRKNLRHQLEDRLRGNVASLRQLIIASRGKERILGRFLKNWYGSLNALYKGLLRLKEVTAIPSHSKDLIKKINELFQVDVKPFLQLIEFRKGEKVNPRNLVYNLVTTLEKLIAEVDKIDLKG